MAKSAQTTALIDSVSAELVDASIDAKAIGQKIRRLRLKRSMGLVALGHQAGLSPSFLSQLETGRVVPTLRNLARIGMVFKKDLSYFFNDKHEAIFRVSPGKDRIRLPVGEKNNPFLLSDSMSALIPDRNVVPCVAEFLPGVEGASFHPQIFPGLEFVYVIQGALVLSTEQKTELLHLQDTAWIDGSARRQYHLHQDKPARALIITFALQS